MRKFCVIFGASISFLLLSLLALGNSAQVAAEPIQIIHAIETGSLQDGVDTIVDIDINTNTNTIYALHHPSQSISIIDSLTNTQIGSIKVGDFESRLFVDEDNNMIYVLHGIGRTVEIIDGSTNSILEYLPHYGNGCIDNCGVDVWQLQDGTDLVILSDSSIYVNRVGDNSTLITSDGLEYKSEELPSQVGEYFTTTAYNPKTDTVYFTRPDTTQVYAIDGTSHEVIAKIIIGIPPDAIAVNPETNKIYVVGDGGMAIIDGSTNSVLPTSLELYSYQETDFIAVNPVSNMVYVVGQDRLSIVNGETNTLEETIKISDIGGWGSGGLVVNPNTNTVYRVSGDTLLAINGDLISNFNLSLTQGTIGALTIDPISKSMMINIDASADGEMGVTLPRELIDARNSDDTGDDKFTVMSIFEDSTGDTSPIAYEEVSTTDTHRELKITVPAGATAVEIVGTYVVPEFPVPVIIMTAAISSIIVLSIIMAKRKGIGLSGMNLQI